MSDTIIHADDASFDKEVLQSDLPVLVDYWAPWCGPCKALAPTLDILAAEYAGKLKIVKVDVQANQQTAKKYGVRGIPTLSIFKNGNQEGAKVGAISKAQLTAFIDATL